MNRDWIDSFPKNIPECIIHKILNLRPIHPVAELFKPEFDSEFAIASRRGKLFIFQYYLGRHQNGREEWKEMKKDEELLMNGVERRTYFY